MSDISGFVVLHRKLLNWEWYDDANTMRLFLHCILKANHAANKWHGQTIERGQFISSRSKLAQELKLTEQQIRTSIKKLELTGEITSEGKAQHTVFTVVSYSKHQDRNQPNSQGNNQQDNQPVTNEQPTDNQRVTTNNNDNNDNNETNKPIPLSPKRKTKTRIDPDLKLSEHWTALASDYWKNKNRLDLDAEDQFNRFKNHHLANGTTSSDWQASWTTWYCNAVDFTRPPLQVVHASQQAAPRPIKTMRPAGSEQ